MKISFIQWNVRLPHTMRRAAINNDHSFARFQLPAIERLRKGGRDAGITYIYLSEY